MRIALRRLLGLVLATATASAVAATTSSDAQATVPAADVQATGKGIAGGALLGGEAGFLVLAGAGARSAWLYATIPTALAIGGGVGGYFVEKNVSSASAPMYMLAGGMALIIPTVVITLSAAATPYVPDDSPSPDKGAQPAPAGASGATSSAASHHVALVIPPSFALVNFDDQTSPRVSLPAVSVTPIYSAVEMSQYGVSQKWQFNAPLVAVNF